jgi:hypothetical protein
MDLFTTEQVVAVGFVGLGLGVALGLLLKPAVDEALRDSEIDDAMQAVAEPFRFDGRQMSEKQRQKLRTLNPAYARVEDARVASDEHADRIRAQVLETVDDAARKAGAA